MRKVWRLTVHGRYWSRGMSDCRTGTFLSRDTQASDVPNLSAGSYSLLASSVDVNVAHRQHEASSTSSGSSSWNTITAQVQAIFCRHCFVCPRIVSRAQTVGQESFTLDAYFAKPRS